VNPGDVEFLWSTATETGNLGFDLYVKQGGEWYQVNETPIPSPVIDSTRVQEYRYQAFGVAGELFALVDIDVFGKETVHGPFRLGKQYGAKRLTRKTTDWHGLRQRHQARQQARKQQRRGQLRGRLRRLQAELATGSSQRAARRGGEQRAQVSELVTLEVSEAGVYRVSHQALLAAGIDLSGSQAKRLVLQNRGQVVPMRVVGQGKKQRRFGPGSYIEFVGSGRDSLYSNTNVYSLGLARRAPGSRVTEDASVAQGTPASFYLATLTVERERQYSYLAPNGDPWFSDLLLAWNAPASIEFEVILDAPVSGAAPVSVAVDLWGVTDMPQAPDHHVVMRWNGVPLAEDQFDGRLARSLRADTDSLLAGPNRLSLSLPLDGAAMIDAVAVDAYRVSYPRRFVARDGALQFTAAAPAFRVTGLPSDQVVVYRVTDSQVTQLTNLSLEDLGGEWAVQFPGSEQPATYHVAAASALKTPALALTPEPEDITGGRAEYLIIAHPDFITADLQLLVQARRAQGMTVKTVDVEQVYAQFGHHLVGAQPIADYIAYARRELDTRYVLLVGGDSYDYQNHLGLGAISFLPTPYARTDALVYFAPVDAKYADVDGDDVPDLAIARFPVRDADELANLVNRTLAYAQHTYPHTAVFAADDFDLAQQYDFKRDSEQTIDAHLQGWTVTRAYLDDLGVAGARSVLLDAINHGVALTSFFGHSGPNVWTFDQLFNTTLAAQLDNPGRPTVVAQWGCWNTYYVDPYEDTLGHQLLLNPDRGAAAVLGASTLTQANAEARLAQLVYQHLLVPGATLGQAVLDAKRQLAQTHPHQHDVILGWTILGDPALSILH
jgi:hypothetical protein